MKCIYVVVLLFSIGLQTLQAEDEVTEMTNTLEPEIISEKVKNRKKEVTPKAETFAYERKNVELKLGERHLSWFCHNSQE